jgi:aminoglycoside 6'-N-acetyltransferase I
MTSQHDFIDLFAAGPDMLEQAASILTVNFTAIGIPAWPDIGAARAEVAECLAESEVLLGVLDGGRLVAWGGLQQMYDDVTWELHPLVTDHSVRGRGIGAALLAELEKRARDRGVSNIALGTDDEYRGTTLADFDPATDDLGEAIRNIRNLRGHPFEFYRKQGYFIVGVVPHANGPGKPDILMWKSLG